MRQIILVSIIILTNCQQRIEKQDANLKSGDSLASQNKTIETRAESFSKFISITPKLNTPIRTHCGQCCDYPMFEMRESYIATKFASDDTKIVGIIESNRNFFMLLTTKAGNPNERNIPSVAIYDSIGTKLDEKEFLTGWCGRDYDYLAIKYLSINSDFTLTEIDTAYSFNMDTETDQIVDTSKMEILRKDFYINKNGKILEK